uniref:Uncharacterized protein n=1 Tax=Astyanax mexicanus TaxID=7994 RepID=A0A8B9KAC2_ASTMX
MKMADKKFKGAPFGSQSHRFDVSGVHPANKRVGTYTQISYCKRRTSDLRNLGPGTYNPDSGDFSARAVRERSMGPDWKRAQETARLAQIPHLLYRDAWNTSVGPGIYKITSFIEDLEKKPGSPKGICETREQRFKDFQVRNSARKVNGHNLCLQKRTNLGPGEYTKEVLKFGEELQRPEKKKHGVFSSLEQYPSVPTERIYLSTLPQCPRLMVHTQNTFIIMCLDTLLKKSSAKITPTELISSLLALQLFGVKATPTLKIVPFNFLNRLMKYNITAKNHQY